MDGRHRLKPEIADAYVAAPDGQTDPFAWLNRVVAPAETSAVGEEPPAVRAVLNHQKPAGQFGQGDGADDLLLELLSRVGATCQDSLRPELDAEALSAMRCSQEQTHPG